jgi:methylmalonyl-CoA mutase, N-terminal domain
MSKEEFRKMSQQYSQSNIPLRRFYRPDDIKTLDYKTILNDPGSFPFTRGRRHDVNPTEAWIQRELSGEGKPSTSNEQFKYLLGMGQTGLDIIGDTPSQGMVDPDHPFARYTVGNQGVSICNLQDYRDLHKDLPLDKITLSYSIPPSFVIAGLYLIAKERNISPAKLRGSVIQSPLYSEDCGYATHLPISLKLRMSSDCIEFCSKNMPKFHSFVEDPYFFSESGLDSIEEMALAFVEIRCVVRELLKRGIDIDTFAPRIAILINCRMDFFEEISKIRATRRIFAKMMKDEFGAKDQRSWSVVITCHTSGLSMTAQQPVNNIVRGAIEALALAIGGVQAIEISAFDEAFRTPSPTSHFIALRTQQIIQCESNVTKVMDPLGGSYYVEALTDDLQKRIWEMVLKIESMGDPAELSEKGWFRNLFTKAMERYTKDIQEKKLLKVGVNIYEIPEEQDTLLRNVAEEKIPPDFDRIEEIKKFKENRDHSKVKEVLHECFMKAKSKDVNLMYPIIKATESGATMGEIAGALRMGYGWNYDPYNMTQPPF